MDLLCQALAIVGEFNGWTPKDHHWASKNEYGTWSLFLPDNADGTSAIPHRCFLKPVSWSKMTPSSPQQGRRFGGRAGVGVLEKAVIRLPF